MRWFSLSILLITSCLAPKNSDDGGSAFVDSGMNGACVASGGVCVEPTACIEQIGGFSCGASGTICCTPVETVAASAAVDASTDGAKSTAVATPDATTTTTTTTTTGASTCNVTCEMTCEGDPNCVVACGC